MLTKSLTQDLIEKRAQAVARGVASAHPVFAARAEGARIWDTEGNEYLDFTSGIGVMNVGHSHPLVVRAVEEQLKRFPPVDRPLVHVHPGSGRKVLFASVHCDRVSGMTVPEGRLFVAELLEHATQREFVYTHTWRAGDYVMWDNRATLHRGLRYDLSARRDLRRTTTLERHAA